MRTKVNLFYLYSVNVRYRSYILDYNLLIIS